MDVLGESFTLVAAGIALGVPAAVGVGHFVSSILFGLSPHDAPSLSIAIVVLVVASLSASYLPARRAAGIDAIHALRTD